MKAEERRRRVVVSRVMPEIDGGRFPIKRVAGDFVVVEAHVFADGHDHIAGDLLWRRAGAESWKRTRLVFVENDEWTARFRVEEPGDYEYTVEARVDDFGSWRSKLAKRIDAGQNVEVDLLIGSAIVEAAVGRAGLPAAVTLAEYALAMRSDAPAVERTETAFAEELLLLMERCPDAAKATRYHRRLRVTVDRERARFSAWYEFFPRSFSPEPGRHGTLRDSESMLDYIADLGFDVVYLPPIHPIGTTHRKGKNNNPVCEPGDVGSPWAIGGEAGGHTAVHPDLGTIADFRHFREAAEERDLEVALDIAFQCSPDHPWVRKHPEWFRARPDGTIQYAENPPKKYEDIYPIDFETSDPAGLWNALRDVFLFWLGHGVRIFRVDNPHTKSFRFWEWVIAEVRREDPGAIFLAEAFTRPKIMYHLAKSGFTQSYTYFTWRDTAKEFEDYLEELTRPPVVEFFRPNFWPNTPDILIGATRNGSRAAFEMRYVLAATLSSNYGIYGPAFELLENTPKDQVTEEYLDSEKYELKRWELDRENIRDLIRETNWLRRENPALRQTKNVTFHPTSNDQLLCYSKRNDDGTNVILVIVNVQVAYEHSGWTELDMNALGLAPNASFVVEDLLSDAIYEWRGPRNFVDLNPRTAPAHVFRVMPAESER